MTDYKVNYDTAYFGHDNPATAVKRVGAVRRPDVERAAATGSSNIGIVSGAHGSHVAGIAAGQRSVRRPEPDGRRGTRGEGRLGSRLPLHLRLHVARPDRGHDLRGRDGRRGRRQHEHRRPAGAERRQQHARGALQPPDRGQRRRRCSSRPATAARVRTRSATRPWRRRSWPSARTSTRETWQKNYGSDCQLPGQPPSVQLQGAGRGRRVQAADRGAWRSDLVGADLAERPARRRASTRFRPGTACSTAPRWQHLRPPARPRC